MRRLSATAISIPDDQIAKALQRRIENYGIPPSIRKQTRRKKIGKVFRDRDELPTCMDLGAMGG